MDINNPNIYKVIALILVILFTPIVSSTLLVLFDYPIIHLLVIYILFKVSSDDIPRTILLALIYMFCVFQRHVALINEMLDSTVEDPNISSTLRYKLARRIISNDGIPDYDKANFVLRVVKSKCKAIYKLNLILAFMENCIDPNFKEEVLVEFLNLQNKNTVIITKFILEDKSNSKPVLNALVKSNIDKNDRVKILKKMSIMHKDDELGKDISKLLLRAIFY